MFKWAGICVLPSVLMFFYMTRSFPHLSMSVQAAFITLHYLSSGVAVYFVLRYLRKAETSSGENIGVLRYMITGVLTAVLHGLIIAVVSASYFNFVRPDQRARFSEEILVPRFVKGKDSTANNLDEYYEHLMAGKDSGVLLPERYEQYRQAALDSLQAVRDLAMEVERQNFSFNGSIIRFVGLAPVFGILFSVIIVVFLKR